MTVLVRKHTKDRYFHIILLNGIATQNSHKLQYRITCCHKPIFLHHS